MSRKIALGVDLGWVNQLESMGVTWVDDNKNGIDPLKAVKAMGANAVRLRVFVNPPKDGYWQKKDGTTCMLGFADADSVLAMAKRVKAENMDLMIDFHYSDHFADPQYQDIPEAWAEEEEDALAERVYQHTVEVLELLIRNGIYPRWVQVGNEINPGILLPKGSLKDAPETMVKLLNAGYDAVKVCCPKCQVITHLMGPYKPEWCNRFFEDFFAHGGKTDILGFSHYPYWFKVDSGKELLEGYLLQYAEKYKKPIMICEVGGPEYDAEQTYNLLCRAIEAIQDIPKEQGLGIFYWEPEVGSELLPDQYPLGAAKSIGDKKLQFTKALKAYLQYQI